MSISFSHIPSDVILHHILPFLDYDSRQTMNQLLSYHERLIKRIPVKERVNHDINAHMLISQNLLHNLNSTHNKLKRVQIWRNYCKELLSYKINTLLKYNKKFNNTVSLPCCIELIN